MAIPYPDWLPLAQKANKNRSSDVGFRTDQPAVGAPIYQKLTDDLKTTWTLTWLFQRTEDRAFEQWLRSPKYLDNGNQWFSMPINLGGSGVQIQELHFTADGYPKQTSDNNGVITWSATVISRGVINSDDDDSDIIVELPPIWWSWLDEIVNRDLPEYVVKPSTAAINLTKPTLDSRVNFSRAGAASYVGSNGLIQQAAANQWPLEYLGGVGRTEPESSSTNLLTYSNTLTNAIWTLGQMTRTGIQASPFGSDAVKLIPSTLSANHIIQQVVSSGIVGSANYVLSYFVKASGYSRARLRVADSVGFLGDVLADLSTGKILVGNASSTLTALSDGWYRLSTTLPTSAAATSLSISCWIYDNSGNATFAGDGVSGIFMTGAQIEKGIILSSPIITTTAAATRQSEAAIIPSNGASAIKITYSSGETTTLSFGGAPTIQLPAATKAWGTRYITLIEYLP